MSSRGNTLESGTRVPALDGVRGIAILLVLLSHLLQFGGLQFRYDYGAWQYAGSVDRVFFRVAYAGWTGVDLFFVLSGFLITGILLDAKGGRLYFRNFYARRFLRIFPIYYTYLFVLFIVLPRLVDLGPDFALLLANQGWYWTYTSNLHSVIAGGSAFPAVGHFWSLAIEEQFYLAWPAVVFYLSRRKLLVVCALCIATSVVVRTLVGVVENERNAAYVLTFARMDTLAIGASLAVLVRGSLRQRGLLRWAWPVAVASGLTVMAIFVWRGRLGEGDPAMLSVGYTVLAVFFGAIVAIAATASPRSLVARMLASGPLVFFGRYSYGLYILHVPVLVALAAGGLSVATLPRIMGSQMPGQILFIAMGTSASVGMSLLSWRFVESPFLRMKRWFPYDAPVSTAVVAYPGDSTAPAATIGESLGAATE